MKSAVSLVNITEEQFVVSLTFGQFVVPGKETGKAFSLTRIGDRVATMDLGDKHRTETTIPAREVAEEIARHINDNAGERSFNGVFVASADIPTREELDSARGKLMNFYEWVCGQAEIEWGRAKSPLMITDLMRRAAKARGITRDWCYTPEQYVNCPACGSSVLPGIAVCPKCTAVLDEKKARQFFPDRLRKQAQAS